MDTEVLIFDNGWNREVIEYICDIFPHIEWAIFPLTLCIKSVNLGDLAGLMISSYQSDTIGIFEFEEE